jgi:hypothetical protein
MDIILLAARPASTTQCSRANNTMCNILANGTWEVHVSAIRELSAMTPPVRKSTERATGLETSGASPRFFAAQKEDKGNHQHGFSSLHKVGRRKSPQKRPKPMVRSK